jgi:uroporphyrinogen-III decarboxylase
MMLSNGSITEIEDYCRKLIRELALGGGYIFSSGHSINPAVTLDRWQAVLRIREKYGNYPIKIPS